MGQELTQANETLLEFERLIQTGGCNAWEGTLRTGVDLGTANIVLAVVDEQNRPVAGASAFLPPMPKFNLIFIISRLTFPPGEGVKIERFNFL